MTGNATRRLRAGTLFVAFTWLSAILVAPLAYGEPDDERETATDLPFGARIASNFESGADSDWFRLTVDTERIVSIWTEGRADTQGTLTDQDGNFIQNDADSGVGTNFRIERRLRAGTYYVLVQPQFLGESILPGRRYMMAASVDHHGDDRESATDLRFDARVQGEINYGSDSGIYGVDQDWFRLTLLAPAYVSVWTEGSADTNGQLYDADGKEIATSDTGNSIYDANFRIDIFLPAGAYYLMVSGAITHQPGVYTLALEQANLPPHTYLASGEQVTKKLSSRSERDYFALHVDSVSKVTVWAVENVSGRSTASYGRLLGADGTEIAFDDRRSELGGFRIEHALGPGTYYVEVSGNGTHTGDYVVATRNEPVPDLASGTRVSFPSRWYSVAVQKPEIVTVWTEGGADTVGRLHGANGVEVASDDNSGDGMNFLIELSLGPGTYLLEVAGEDAAALLADAAPVPNLAFGTRVSGEIGPAGDHYRLIVESPSRVTVWTEGAADTVGNLYRDDGSYVASDWNSGEGDNFLIERTLLAGAYYVGVTAGRYGTTDEYVLAAEAEPVPDLTFGTRVRGNIEPAGDADWYRLTVDTPQFVTIWTEGETDTRGILSNRDGLNIGGDSDDGESGNFRIERLFHPGTYFLVVVGQGGGATGEYTLAAEAEPALDTAFGDRIEGEIGSAGERDRYVLNLEAGIWQVVAFWSEGDTDTVVRIYDSAGRVVAFDDDGGEGRNFRIERALAPGRYYVEVAGYSDNTGRYVLASGITDTVPRLWFGQRIPGELSSSGDSEIYRLAVDSPVIVTVWTEGGVDTEGILYDEYGNEVAYDVVANRGDNVRGNFRLERVLGAGAYYLAVRKHSGGVDYVVAAEAEPVPDLELGVLADSEFEPAGDVDWFRFSVTTPSRASVRMVDEDDTNPQIRVYDEDGNYPLWAAARGDGELHTLESSLGPGAYYVEVRSLFVPGRTGEYSLVAFANPEPVTDLAPGGRVTDEFSDGDDVDWYRLSVDTLTFVTVRTEGAVATVGRLHRSGGGVIASDDGRGEGNNFGIERVLGPGDYYIEVSADSAGQYVLVADSGPIPATDLAFGNRVPDEIRPADDADWYRLTVTAPAHVSVRTEGDTDTVGRLIGANGNEIAADDDSGGAFNFLIGHVLEPGSYYVVVESSEDRTGDYVVVAEVEPTVELVLGVPATGRLAGIAEGEDANWYRLQLSQPASVAVYATGDLNTAGSLHDESGAQIASDDNTGEELNFHIEGQRQAGVYFIRVESHDLEAGRYTLHARRYVDVPLPETGGETVRLWAIALGGWTLDRGTDLPFVSGGEVAASNGQNFELTLGSDGVWTALAVVGSCEAHLRWAIDTLAGTGVSGGGGDGGPAANAQLSALSGVAADAAGYVYVSDWSNHRIRRIGPDGTIETIAGTGVGGYAGDGGPATQAQLEYPRGVAADAAGNVYVADTSNHRVRRIASDGTISTFAGTGAAGYGGDGGPATDARLDTPYGVAVDAAGYVYVSETANHRIRRIAPNGRIDTYAGTGVAGGGGDGGPATAARLAFPHGLSVDAAGNVYVADRNNQAVRRIAPDGTIETIAGTGVRGDGGDGGPATQAQFNDPLDVAVDAAGNVYVADTANHRIRRIVPEGTISTFAGTGAQGYAGDGGLPTAALLNLPYGVTVDSAGRLLIADTGNYRVRVLRPADDHGDRAACPTPLLLGVPVPGRIETSADADWFRLELSEAASVAIYTTGDLDTAGRLHDESEARIAFDDDSGEQLNFHIEGNRPAGVYYLQVESYGGGTGNYTLHARRYADVELGGIGEAVRLWAVSGGGWTLDRDTGAPFASGSDVIASNGDRYVLTLGSDGAWRAVPASPSAGACEADLAATIRTLAGTGTGLDYPTSLAVDAAGYVYAADSLDHQILRIAPNGSVEAIAGAGEQGYGGDGGPATAALLDNPSGVAVDAEGNVYFADGGNYRVRRIDPDGVITTIAGTGVEGFGGDGGPATAAQLSPSDVVVDTEGNVYIADAGNHRVRRIGPDGIIGTVAGVGGAGFGGDGGPATEARLDRPIDVAVDAARNLYIADYGNHRIRRVDPYGFIATIAGTGVAGFGGDGGPATAARLHYPIGVTVDAVGNVYVADRANHKVRRIRPGGIIEIVAGSGVEGSGGDGGPAVEARLDNPLDVAVDAAGALYIADFSNSRIRVVDPPADAHGDSAACATPLALGAPMPGRIEKGDDEDWFRLELSEAASVAIYTTGNLDTVGSLRDASDTELANDDDSGTGRNFHVEGERPAGVYFVRVASFGTGTGAYTLHARRYADVVLGETGETVRLWGMADGGWTLDPATDEAFESGGEVDASNGARYVLTLGADGIWTASAVTPPSGSCEAPRPWTIDSFAGTGVVADFGDGGPATEAALNRPSGVAVDAAGYVYIADGLNHRIRRIAPDGTIDTFAGTGASGYGGDGGPATQARLNWPNGVALDTAGNVYVADYANNRIRRIAPDGTIETFAGTGQAGSGGDGGPAAQARLNWPADVAVDALGNVYVAEYVGNRIRRIRSDGTIETLAGTGVAGNEGDGGPATEAQINRPLGVAVDIARNVYIADQENHRIRRIAPDGIMHTVAGTGSAGYGGDGGPATQARLNRPSGVAVDDVGRVYVADAGNNRVRRFAPGEIIETIAGTGSAGFGGDGGRAELAQLDDPFGVAVDARGYVFVADADNHRIRVLEPPADDHGDGSACATVLQLGTPVAGEIETNEDADWFRLELSEAASVAIYTTGDVDTVGSLRGASGTQIASDDDGGADTNFHMESDLAVGRYYIRVVPFQHPSVQGLDEAREFGGGVYTLHTRLFADVPLREPGGETVRLWGTATGGWTLDRATDAPFRSGGEVVASDGARFTLTLGSGGVWTASPAVEMCEASLAGTIRTLGGMAGLAGYAGDGGFAVDARLDNPFDVAVDAAGNVFVAERFNHRIRMIGPDGIIATFAGTGAAGFGGDGGPAAEAGLNRPVGVAVDAAGYVYVADRLNHRVRRIATDGTIETIAGTGTDGYGGDGGPATAAQLDEPTGVAVDTAGNVYVADSQNHRIRRIGPSGTIETIAGTGSSGHAGDGGPATQARLTLPFDMAVDARGSVYIADTFNQRIRRIAPDGTIETFAGTGTEGYGGDGGRATGALLNHPSGVAVSAAGYVFVADWGNDRIRRIGPDGTIATFAGTGAAGYGGDGGAAVQAQLRRPAGVTVDAMGRVYIADASSHRVRVVDLAEGCR